MTVSGADYCFSFNPGKLDTVCFAKPEKINLSYI